MWALVNIFRQKAKMGVVLLVWDLFLLGISLTCITAYTEKIMHPAIITVGLIWVMATAGAIWHFGSVAVDSLFLADLMHKKVGEEFTRALNIFFVLGCTTVVFFALFPVWKYWPSALILPVLLVGLFTSSNLAGRKTNWGYFYNGYLWLILIALISILVFGMTHLTQDKIGDIIERPWNLSFSSYFNSWPWRMALFGAVLLAAAIFIPKKVELPGRKLTGFVGSALLIAGMALIFFPEVQAKIEKTDPPAATHHRYDAANSNAQLPANAKLVAAIEPGEIVWQRLTRPDEPPPKRWTVNAMTGYVGREAPWPTGSKICGTRNPVDQDIELYIEGQDVKISSAPPKKQRGD